MAAGAGASTAAQTQTGTEGTGSRPAPTRRATLPAQGSMSSVDASRDAGTLEIDVALGMGMSLEARGQARGSRDCVWGGERGREREEGVLESA